MTFSTDAVAAMQDWIVRQTTGVATRLTAPIAANAVSLPVASSAGAAVGDTWIVDSGVLVDAFSVTGIPNGTTLTVVHNAQYGTTQQAHATGSQVQQLTYPTFQLYCKQVVTAAVQPIVAASQVAPTIATAQAAIATQQAAIQTTVTGAVT
jgi:hypothetical protein